MCVCSCLFEDTPYSTLIMELKHRTSHVVRILVKGSQIVPEAASTPVLDTHIYIYVPCIIQLCEEYNAHLQVSGKITDSFDSSYCTIKIKLERGFRTSILQ